MGHTDAVDVAVQAQGIVSAILGCSAAQMASQAALHAADPRETQPIPPAGGGYHGTIIRLNLLATSEHPFFSPFIPQKHAHTLHSAAGRGAWKQGASSEHV